MLKIVNKKSFRGKGIYIGRPSALGNPYKVGVDGPRAEVIDKYRDWLRVQWQEDRNIKALLIALAILHQSEKEVHLICWYSPKPCHGDVIIDAAAKIAERLLGLSAIFFKSHKEVCCVIRIVSCVVVNSGFRAVESLLATGDVLCRSLHLGTTWCIPGSQDESTRYQELGVAMIDYRLIVELVCLIIIPCLLAWGQGKTDG